MSLQKNKEKLPGLFYDCLYTYKPSNFLIWAEENIEFPRGHSSPGPYRWRKKTPYLWEIAEALLDPRYDYVVLWMPSQSGKTMALLLWLLYTFIYDPTPFTFAVPKKDMAKEMSRNRFDELVNAYRGGEYVKLIDGESNAETYEKRINGLPLRFVWMTSADKLASYATPRIAIDEVDRIVDTQKEGSPEELLDTRTTTYEDEKKIAKTSSPLIEGESRIASAFYEGNQRVAHIPCTKCRFLFEPTFATCHWPSSCKTDEDVRKEARVVCPNCAYKMTTNELRKENYVYIGKGQRYDHQQKKVVGELIESRTASFRVNGLLSGFNTIGRLCARWWKADRDPDKRLQRLQTVINTGFGELWKIPGQEIEWEGLRGKCLGYKSGQVPSPANTLVSAADVHGHDLHYTIWGFDSKRNGYLIDWGVIHGDTRESKTWEIVDPLLYKEYEGFKISKSGIDCGYRPDYVKDFIKVYRKKYHPIIGRQQSKPMMIEAEEVNPTKMRVAVKKKDLKMVKICDDYWKEAIFQRLEFEGENDKNMIYFPDNVTDNFLRQITGEKRVIENGVRTFERTRENHFLDCTKMCYALAYEMLKVGIKKRKK